MVNHIHIYILGLIQQARNTTARGPAVCVFFLFFFFFLEPRQLHPKQHENKTFSSGVAFGKKRGLKKFPEVDLKQIQRS